MSDDTWLKIVRLHNEAKNLIIQAEEFDKGFRDFLQPILEQRHALEHIIRVRTAELGERPDSDKQYISGNLEKALGHEYRAFFDVADWLSLRIREKFTETFSQYSYSCIAEVVPGYYQKTRPRIEELNSDIQNCVRPKMSPTKKIYLKK